MRGCLGPLYLNTWPRADATIWVPRKPFQSLALSNQRTRDLWHPIYLNIQHLDGIKHGYNPKTPSLTVTCHPILGTL